MTASKNMVRCELHKNCRARCYHKRIHPVVFYPSWQWQNHPSRDCTTWPKDGCGGICKPWKEKKA